MHIRDPAKFKKHFLLFLSGKIEPEQAVKKSLCTLEVVSGHEPSGNLEKIAPGICFILRQDVKRSQKAYVCVIPRIQVPFPNRMGVLLYCGGEFCGLEALVLFGCFSENVVPDKIVFNLVV